MTEIINEILPETNKIYKTRFICTIENFLRKSHTVSYFDFEIPGLTKCHLEVHPNNKMPGKPSKFCKLVFRMDPPTVRAVKNRTVKFEMVASRDFCIWSDQFEYDSRTERVKEDFFNHIWEKSYMEGNDLKIKGCIRVTEYDWSLANDSMLPAEGRKVKIVDDIRSLASSGILSDFTFILEGRKLEVHKAILAARSPVFERMFTGEFREAKSGSVEITDISADAFEEFLYYIYAGDLRNPDFSVGELVFVADRYGVTDLLKLCEMKLLRSINDDNAETIYRIANHIECNTELKKVAFEVLQSKFKRFSISLPNEYISTPEKVYKSLELQKQLKQLLEPEIEDSSESNMTTESGNTAVTSLAEDPSSPPLFSTSASAVSYVLDGIDISDSSSDNEGASGIDAIDI